MARVLLAVAASLAVLIVPTQPAGAQDAAGAGMSGLRSPGLVGSIRDSRNIGGCSHRRGGDPRLQCGAFADGWAYADGEWARYNNQSWAPDSFNDWWNDRPDRAYPRWVREQHRQGTCTPDRMWWSGSGWHC